MSHEIRIKIRWRDMDHYGHVNNAVYLTYLEECRDRMVEGLMGSEGAWDFVLAHVGIDYRNQLTQDDGEITVRCAVASFGAFQRADARDHREGRRDRGCGGRGGDRAARPGHGALTAPHRRREADPAGGDRW